MSPFSDLQWLRRLLLLLLPLLLGACAGAHSTRLAKRVWTGPVLVVVLGLDGAGHRQLCSVLQPTCHFEKQDENSTLEAPPCIAHDHLLQKQMRDIVTASPATLRLRQARRLRRLRILSTASNSARILFQCFASRFHPDESWGFAMSYPDRDLGYQANSQVEGYVTFHMDAVDLARAAEEAGLDVRFLVLRTDPGIAAQRLVVNEGMRFSIAARILKDNDVVLESQLENLSPEFYMELLVEEIRSAPFKTLSAFLKMNESLLEEHLASAFPMTDISGLSREQQQFITYVWNR